MKLTEYLVFAALLAPTLVVVLAAVVSFALSDPTVPEYHPPLQAASTANG